MGKFLVDGAADAALAYIRDQTGFVSICNAQPTTVGQGTTAGNYSLGTATYGTANWTIADDTTVGRKITAAAVAVPVTTSGTVSHIAYYNAGTIIACGTCAPTAVTAGGTFTVNSYDFDKISDIA
jgi:hypothetical protein